MAYSILKERVIDYPATSLREFRVYGFEWIDDLNFILSPEEFLVAERVDDYLTIARERFKEAGWPGDGDIGLLWLPPFVFPLSLRIPPQGVVVWHVKQSSNGVSWLLSPIALPFDEFQS
jgi:hypothetical protein